MPSFRNAPRASIEQEPYCKMKGLGVLWVETVDYIEIEEIVSLHWSHASRNSLNSH